MTDHRDVPLIATGDWIDAAWINSYIGDNVRAWRQGYTQQGAMAYALDANTLAELAPPATKKVMTHPGGAAAPAWGSVSSLKTILTKNATQYHVGGSNVAIVFQVETADDEGLHSTSSNTERITFVQSGIYLVILTVGLVTGVDYINLYKNGSSVVSRYVTNNYYLSGTEQIITFMEVVAGDYIHGTAGSLSAAFTLQTNCFFSALRLGL